MRRISVWSSVSCSTVLAAAVCLCAATLPYGQENQDRLNPAEDPGGHPGWHEPFRAASFAEMHPGLGSGSVASSFCSPPVILERFSFAAPAMGTEFRILIYAVDSLGAAKASADAFSLADSLEMIMSDYLPESELNRLSSEAGSGRYVQVSKPLAHVLVEAQKISDVTDGAFDVTAGTLTRLWRRGIRRGTVPSDSAIARARSTVDYRSITFDSTLERVSLTRPGTRLDLGGIAKGYAADRMLERLRLRGYRRALVDAGGDIAVGDAPPGMRGWTVAIDPIGDARESPSPVPALIVANGAVATSGDRYRYVERDGRRYSHVVDPKSGYGTSHTHSVTVLARSATHADAFASAFSVMPVDKAIYTAESHSNLEARILSRTDSTDVPVIRHTSGFMSR